MHVRWFHLGFQFFIIFFNILRPSDVFTIKELGRWFAGQGPFGHTNTRKTTPFLNNPKPQTERITIGWKCKFEEMRSLLHKAAFLSRIKASPFCLALSLRSVLLTSHWLPVLVLESKPKQSEKLKPWKPKYLAIKKKRKRKKEEGNQTVLNSLN